MKLLWQLLKELPQASAKPQREQGVTPEATLTLAGRRDAPRRHTSGIGGLGIDPCKSGGP